MKKPISDKDRFKRIEMEAELGHEDRITAPKKKKIVPKKTPIVSKKTPISTMKPPKISPKGDKVEVSTPKKHTPQEKGDGLVSVSEIAAELGFDAKIARAKLRRQGKQSADGRWPRVKPGSKEYKELKDIISAKSSRGLVEDLV